MAIYYRFDTDPPRRYEKYYCFRTLQGLKDFIDNMRSEKVSFPLGLKYWEIDGTFIEDDGDDAVVQVNNAKRIYL